MPFHNAVSKSYVTKRHACKFLYFIACCATSLLWNVAAGQSRIEGQVKDGNGNPLPYANVLLLHAIDSAYAKGTITNTEGKFILDGIKTGHFLIVSTMVGFKKTTLPIIEISEGSNINLESFILEEESTQLNEVVILAEKPMFEQQIDKLVVNVKNSITSAGGTALEVLERSPGVIVNRQANSLSMNGKQGVMVMFNGKMQRLPMEAVVQLLNSMPASSIEKIELITNPSARYDAQGDAGIINIVSAQNPAYGTNGSLTASLGYSQYAKSSGSLNINHRAKNFAIYADYSVTYNKLWEQFSLDRIVTNPDQQTVTVSNRYAITPVHQARIGTEWALGKNTSINTLISGFDNKWKMDAYNDSHVKQSGRDSADIKLYDREVNHWKNLMGNININHVFKAGNALNMDVDYLYYHDNNPHDFVNDYAYLQTNIMLREQIRISKKTPINMGVFKIDYEHKVNKLKIETGVKATYSRLENNVLVEKRDHESWQSDPKFTQDYAMKDDVLAAYASVGGQFSEKSKFQFGLRTEHTDMEIETQSKDKIFDLNFWSLFPSAFYSKQINSNNSFQISYGRRITRPSYQDIAPFVIFMDPFTYFSGNPKLKPTITNGLQISYTFKDLLVSAKYSHDKDYIANFQSRVDPLDKKTYFYSENLDEVQTYSLSLSSPLIITNWWKLQVNLMGFLQQVNTLYQEVPVSITQFSGQFNLTQKFTLPRNYTFEISARYNTPSNFGIANVRSNGSVSAGIQKKMKNSGTLSLNINDIFWTDIFQVETINDNLNQHQISNFRAEPRVVRLSYAYTFGKSSVKSSKQRSTASEVEQGRVK